MSRCTSITGTQLKRHPLPPVIAADKDVHGRLLVIAGSQQTPGSAAIAATSAMRTGCGSVSIATVEPIAPHVALAVPEALVIALPMGRDGGISSGAVAQVMDRLGRYDAVVAGPGMVQGNPCERLAKQLFKAGVEPLVLDAAMLYAMPPHAQAARAAPCPILLPHDREMAALIGCDEEEANREPLRCARLCAERYGALVLMKGPKSHVAAPDGRAWRYEGGGPGLGISGSGDTLAGILGGLLARGAEPLTALLWGVWLHGEAGASLSKKVGMIGFLAREISAEVPALLAKNQPSLA
jgi:hydroxyethylthiazole kinase-like uncharacterized protein yjeF